MVDIVDDATSRMLYAQLWPAETTQAVLSAPREIIRNYGIPISLYTDRAAWAFRTSKAGERKERVVGADNTVRFDNDCLQIERQPGRATCAGRRVKVRRHLDGHVTVWDDGRLLGRYRKQEVQEEALCDIGETEFEDSGFQGMEGSGISPDEERSPKAPLSDIPSPTLGYPSAGCSPAEPASVSPSESTV